MAPREPAQRAGTPEGWETRRLVASRHQGCRPTTEHCQQCVHGRHARARASGLTSSSARRTAHEVSRRAATTSARVASAAASVGDSSTSLLACPSSRRAGDALGRPALEDGTSSCSPGRNRPRAASGDTGAARGSLRTRVCANRRHCGRRMSRAGAAGRRLRSWGDTEGAASRAGKGRHHGPRGRGPGMMVEAGWHLGVVRRHPSSP